MTDYSPVTESDECLDTGRWLAGSLGPASSAERKVAQRAQDKAGQLAEPVRQNAQEVAGNLQQPLQESAEQVKAAALQAAGETTEQAMAAASDLTQSAQQ